MLDRLRGWIVLGCSVLICLFTLVEANYPSLTPQSQLAIFAMLGIVICFLKGAPSPDAGPAWRIVDFAWAAVAVFVCSFVVLQSEEFFRSTWLGGQSLGNRAGHEQTLDYVVGVLGLVTVLEVTRRTVGLALPILASAFILYAYLGPWMPEWLFPHRGYSLGRIVSQTFLHSQGVFGMATKVMFTYVFLFVVFGAFLEATGATQFIIDFARRLFRGSRGGAAKVSVLSSGLMGSLSGSAVANTAATGTFTIPLMRSSGFQAPVAAGVAAAASSGGALMPPIMGAGAYMMLEILPSVTYLEIIRAALLPAILYYLSLLLIVHFYACRIGSRNIREEEAKPSGGQFLQGSIFFGALGVLILMLVVGYSPFRAVTVAIGAVAVLGALSSRTRITPRSSIQVLKKAALSGVGLVAAACCVGIIIGVVTLTGVGTRFAGLLIPMAEQNLFLALVLIMISSIVLGMGLPSAVCYLLLATIIGAPLSQLGVVPLAAHLFIFYFGMMSMVTPPVALAAYTGASIAGSPIMATSLAAFRFALVGFSLPFFFVTRPQLLMLRGDGSTATVLEVAPVLVLAILGVVPLAAGIAGYLFAPLDGIRRFLLLACAVLILYPGQVGAGTDLTIVNWIGIGVLAVVSSLNWKASRGPKRDQDGDL